MAGGGEERLPAGDVNAHGLGVGGGAAGGEDVRCGAGSAEQRATWLSARRGVVGAAAIARVAVRGKASKAPQGGATGASEDGCSRVSEAGIEQTVVYGRPRENEAEPTRLYAIVEQVGNPVKVHDLSYFTRF
mgnify:CR=1 FL=1